MAQSKPCSSCRYFEKLAAPGTGSCSVRAPETGFVTKVNSNGTCTRYEPANGRRVRYRPIGAEVLARLDNASVAALEALTCGLDATTATTRAKDIAAAAWVLARELEEQRAAWLKEWSKHHTDE